MDEQTKELRKLIYSYVQGSLDEEQVMALWKQIALNPELLDQLELETGIEKLLRDGYERS